MVTMNGFVCQVRVNLLWFQKLITQVLPKVKHFDHPLFAESREDLTSTLYVLC